MLSKVVAEKSLTEKLSICTFIRVAGKIENLKKEGYMRISILICIDTIHFAYLKVYTKLKKNTLAPIGAEKSATYIFIGKKEK